MRVFPIINKRLIFDMRYPVRVKVNKLDNDFLYLMIKRLDNLSQL